MKDLHTHTIYSDGKNTPEEMVLAAIELGLDTIGISDHSYTDFSDWYCVKKDKIEEYRSEITRLKEKYKDRIEVLLGVEQDYYSYYPAEGYDYVIGSVHFVEKDGHYIPVDEDPDDLLRAADELYDGDIYGLVEDYFANVADVVNRTGCDIIGHFDLITKLNEQHSMFDTESERYKAAEKKAMDALLKTGVPFEINTGGIFRGYRSEPYPSISMQMYILAHGGKLIMSSDSHTYESIGYGFEMWDPMRSTM